MASTKCVLRHPDSASARETRDTVFCQMRRAIDLIHFVIREGISADQGADDVDLIDMPGVSYQVNTVYLLYFATAVSMSNLDQI